MKPPDPVPLPSHAYVPGRSPRHDEGAFAGLHASVVAGMSPAELAQTAAWHAGLVYLDAGYFWEAHEVLEPVWMETEPGSPARALVQGVIQIANAALKQRMVRPKAVRRLCDIADAHLDRVDSQTAAAMAVDISALRARIADLRHSSQKDAL